MIHHVVLACTMILNLGQAEQAQIQAVFPYVLSYCAQHQQSSFHVTYQPYEGRK